jgi:hypothetical protein
MIRYPCPIRLQGFFTMRKLARVERPYQNNGERDGLPNNRSHSARCAGVEGTIYRLTAGVASQRV